MQRKIHKNKKIKNINPIQKVDVLCKKFVKKLGVLNKKQKEIIFEYKKVLDKIK